MYKNKTVKYELLQLHLKGFVVLSGTLMTFGGNFNN